MANIISALTNILAAATLSQVLVGLEGLGITGEAAKLLDKHAGGPERRQAARILATMKAAIEWVTSGTVSFEEARRDPYFALQAFWVMKLNAGGVGGTNDMAGEATVRHPAFKKCGAGRKKARDGGPWMMALEQAQAQIIQEMVEANSGFDTQVKITYGGDHVQLNVGACEVCYFSRLSDLRWHKAAVGRSLIQKVNAFEAEVKEVKELADAFNRATELFQIYAGAPSWAQDLWNDSMAEDALMLAETRGYSDPPVDDRVSKVLSILGKNELVSMLQLRHLKLESILEKLQGEEAESVVSALKVMEIEVPAPPAPPAVPAEEESYWLSSEVGRITASLLLSPKLHLPPQWGCARRYKSMVIPRPF